MAFASDLPKVGASQIYEFTLTRGKGQPVCEAYLQRLNTQRFQEPPYCDRPEDDSAPGFSALQRHVLSPKEAFEYIYQVDQFLNKPSPHLTYAGGKFRLEDVQQDMDKHVMQVWRYAPLVDIDNDGKPDNILVWSVGGWCGEAEGNDPAGVRPMFSVFILTPDRSKIDEEKTRAIFAHPVQKYSGTMASGKLFVVATPFRPIGKSFGIFNYQGISYFDTFFDIWGDYEDKRRGKPELANHLAVFLRKDGKTSQICEYRMNGNDYSTSPAWTLIP